MNRKELRDKIATLEGLTIEEKSALIDLLGQKKYGLVWENKPEDVEERLRKEIPVLREVKGKALLNGADDAPNHILIEGDNLEALTALTYTHEGMIDVIYIDPPYNTGNNDFVYNDKFIDKEDSYRHSKWLSFMDKRLRIAKKLLSDKGVIFISIDDNEQANLKLLCDEVFNSVNYISCLPRVTKKGGKDHSDAVALNHDFLLIYCKNRTETEFQGVSTEVKGFDNIDEFVATRGKYKLNQTLDYDSLWYNPAMDFPLEIDGEMFYAGGSEEKHELRHKGEHNAKDWVWRWSQAKFDFGYNNGFVVVKKGKDRKRIYTKTYLNASISKNDNGYFVEYSERETKLSSLALTENEFSNDNAKKQIANIIDGNVFDFPKPTSLISQLLNITKNNSIVLDFFAGSGTTLHATMQLNAEDGGHRQCILVTNNENNICEEVTYERNKRVINGYTKPNGDFVEGLHNNNLRYYTIDHIERESSLSAKRKLMLASTDLLCIKHDIYDEQEVFGSLKLRPSFARYFKSADKQMLVIYNTDAIERIVAEIETMPEETNIMVYVFSTNNYAYDDDFEDVSDKVTLCALPAAIYNAYLKVLPKKGEPKPTEEEE